MEDSQKQENFRDTERKLRERIAKLEEERNQLFEDNQIWVEGSKQLTKENEELKTQLDKMYNLDEVTVDCTQNEIAFTTAMTNKGNMVHMIVFHGTTPANKGFSIMFTEEQWERIAY